MQKNQKLPLKDLWPSISNILPWLVGLGVVALDQITKWWAVVAGFMHANSGASFSLFSEQLAGQQWVLILATGLALVGMAVLFWRQQPLAVSLVLGGGFSNVLDRVVRGAVVDWLWLPGLRVWNNLADWFVFLGMVWLATILLRPADQD